MPARKESLQLFLGRYLNTPDVTGDTVGSEAGPETFFKFSKQVVTKAILCAIMRRVNFGDPFEVCRKAPCSGDGHELPRIVS